MKRKDRRKAIEKAKLDLGGLNADDQDKVKTLFKNLIEKERRSLDPFSFIGRKLLDVLIIGIVLIILLVIDMKWTQIINWEGFVNKGRVSELREQIAEKIKPGKKGKDGKKKETKAGETKKDKAKPATVKKTPPPSKSKTDPAAADLDTEKPISFAGANAPAVITQVLKELGEQVKALKDKGGWLEVKKRNLESVIEAFKEIQRRLAGGKADRPLGRINSLFLASESAFQNSMMPLSALRTGKLKKVVMDALRKNRGIKAEDIK